MSITFADFKPVTLDDKEMFLSQFSRFPPSHSDNSFINMICWNHFAHYRYAKIGDSILISSTIGENTKFRPPLGPKNPDLMRDLFRTAVAYGDEKPVVLIEKDTRDWILEQYPKLPLHADRNYFEYVYRTDDLADLPGQKYQNIRRQLNRFQRNCNPAVELIDDGNLIEVQEFLLEWCEWRDCDSEPFLLYEKEAILFAISHFGELGLSGLLIRVSGKIGAIALFEILSQDTAVVHFEKGLPDCEGIYKAINAETARFLKGRVKFINRESDMGVAGLRTAKTRYRPHHMVEVYYVQKEDLIQILQDDS